MKTAIPKIKIDFASTLPKSIVDCLWSNKSNEHLFVHVRSDENIDFYCKPQVYDFLRHKIEKGMIRDEAGNTLTFETITPYFEAYSLGFNEGFYELDKVINSEMFFPNEEIRARKIFEYASTFRSAGFPELCGHKEYNCITQTLWHDAGVKAGYYYKAWYIIANNHEPFIKYFEKPETEIEQKPGVKSFTWTGSLEQLEALWQALRDAGYIAQGTTPEEFKAIFSGHEIDVNLNRITWIKPAQKNRQLAKNAVIALFDLLANSEKIPMDETTNRAELFRKLHSCFCDQSGKPLTFEHSHCKYSKQTANILQQIISSL